MAVPGGRKRAPTVEQGELEEVALGEVALGELANGPLMLPVLGSVSCCFSGYQSSDLAYAITGHSAQGATVHTGIALVTGAEDRQWLYPAMTRGTDANLVFVFTTPPKVADPQPGTRAAPELERY